MATTDASASLHLSRGIRRGWLLLRRGRGWWTTLGALTGVVLIIQLLWTIGLGAQGMHRLLESRLDLRLQVQATASDQEIQEFIIALKDQPGVREVLYITREQAYERERARSPDLIAFLEEFNIANPFPDTLAVTLKSLSEYDDFAAFVRQSAWATTVDPAFLSHATDQEKEVHQLLRLAGAATTVVAGFLVLAALVLLFVLMELIRRRALMRKEEILVERLVGAHSIFTLTPFITEATILLWAATALSMLLLGGFLFGLPILVPALASGGPFDVARQQVLPLLQTGLPVILVVEILAMPPLAAAGAYLGMRPQLSSGRLHFAHA